jgi:GTP-binding protein EngB required for normal cell division
MGGSSIDDDWEFESTNRTLVIVGRAGNGKSATGNSILQKNAFVSRRRLNGVTSTCQQQTTVLSDGQIINVIDTPGLFDFSLDSEFVEKEIVRCIDMAKDGIHAVLLVLSTRQRFTQEEAAAIRGLQDFFGNKINDFMVVVFTGGDELEENGETLEEFIECDCPEPLKKILERCENRRVLFDNKTTDKKKKDAQVKQLLSLVDRVVVKNGNKPYTNEIFIEMKKGALKLLEKTEKLAAEGYAEHKIIELKAELSKTNEEQLTRITGMVEMKLKETTKRLEEQLAKEQAARLKAEQFSQEAQLKSNDEIRRLRENLEKAQKEYAELRSKAERCTIL